MNRALTLVMSAAVAVSVACNRNAQPSAAATGSDSTLVVAMERGPCYGFCPVYSVELYESGRVTFTGTRNVRIVGTASDTIERAAVDSLKRLIAATGFAEFDTAYVLDSPGCGAYATDLPVITVKAMVGTSLKTVRHELGCQGGPAAIQQLAAKIDTVTRTATWVKNGQEVPR
jgi:hypothetical protein